MASLTKDLFTFVNAREGLGVVIGQDYLPTQFVKNHEHYNPNKSPN